MSDIHKILNTNEKVLWQGKPAFLPFVFSAAGCATFVFGLFWTAVTVPLLGGLFMGDGQLNWWILAIPHLYIGPLMMFGSPISKALVHRFTNYAITDKRIIIEKGLIGRDFDSIDFDQITNISVNIDLFDKIFGGNTGSVLIQTASSYRSTKNGMVAAPFELDSIQDPYNIFKNLKQSSHDVKTDINYPNALRPNTNPGYGTQLQNDPFAQPGQTLSP